MRVRLLVLLLCLYLSPSLADNGLLEIHFIDVGQGDCTLVSCPDGETVLIDCGSSGGGDAAQVRQYLQNVLGTTSVDIDTLVVTHPDKDHYNLLPDVVQDGTVDQVFKIGSKKDYKIVSARNWLYGHKDKFITNGARFHDKAGFPNEDIDCGQAEVYVLAWNVKAKGSNRNLGNHKVNARSIVLLFLLDDFEVILTGDATFDTEDAITARYGTWLPSEVLKVGHHGSSTTSNHDANWVQKVQAEYAVVSASSGNTFGHPRQSVINRLEVFTVAEVAHPMRWWTGSSSHGGTAVDTPNYTEAIYSTATSGNIVISSNGSATPTVRRRPISPPAWETPVPAPGLHLWGALPVAVPHLRGLYPRVVF